MIVARRLALFYRERTVFLLYTLSIVTSLLAVALIIFAIDKTRGIITLHYDIFFGIDRIGSWQRLFLYPGLAMVLVFVNFCFSYLLFPRDKYLSYYLGIASALISGIVMFYILSLISFQ